MGQAGRGSDEEAGHKAAMNAEEVKEVDLAEMRMEPRHYQRCQQSNYDLITARHSQQQRWPQWNGRDRGCPQETDRNVSSTLDRRISE
jgi:hypothetical protein